MKGVLVKLNNDTWYVKWSDLYLCGHGTHWLYTELSPESNAIMYLKDGEIKYDKLKENIEVEFEHIIDKGFQNPFRYAKLIFTEIEKFEKRTIKQVKK